MTKKKTLTIVMIIYIVCFLCRLLEYFVLRTDKTWVGEAVVHKIIGIMILYWAAKLLNAVPGDYGFARGKWGKGTIRGLAFGAVMFVCSYGIEILIAFIQGKFQSLQIYVSAYAIDKNIGMQTGVIFLGICIAGNIINVVMEEGIFRGCFMWLLEKKFAFLYSAIFSSLLFGLWHVVGPVRNYMDGALSVEGMIANIVMLVVTSGLVGFKFVLLTKVTGDLYMAMGDHFVNNTIVNLLHVVTNSGVDELMIARLAIAQSISCTIVIVYYLIWVRRTGKVAFSCK